jgi:threonine aldolase
MSHTQRGDAAIVEEESHIIYYEASSIASIAGVLPIIVKGNKGILDPEVVNKKLTVQHRVHQPEVKLICLENTHNRAGGVCITPEQTQMMAEVAQSHDIKLYIDGARIFNASVALNIDVKNLTKNVDSVSFCLSKGLSAPIGSLICGSTEFIERVVVNRQRVGGAMRQAGIIAAPGIVALDTMIERLKEDHGNAKLLANGLANFGLDVNDAQTNIVLIDVSSVGHNSDQFISKLMNYQIKASNYGSSIVRMVTHRGIDTSHIKYVLESISDLMNDIKKNKSIL